MLNLSKWRKSGKYNLLKSSPLCRYCGGPIDLTHWAKRLRGSRKYCSPLCLRRSKRVTLKCKNCHKAFVRLARWNKSKNVFCSARCSAAWQKGRHHACWAGGGGRDRVGTETWRKKAKQVRNRDADQCQVCHKARDEKRQKFPVDHIIPYRLAKIWAPGHEDDSENLLTLCQTCHGVKIKAEIRLRKGDRLAWEQELKALGYPMDKVESAFRHLMASCKK